MARRVREALEAVGTVMAQSVVSGTVALITALIYTLGNFWTGRSPAHQSWIEFVAALMVHLSFLMWIIAVLGYSVPLARLHWTKQPNKPPTLWFWFRILLGATWIHYIVAAAGIVGVCMACTHMSASWKPYHFHFYASTLMIHHFTVVVDVTSRDLYLTETIKGGGAQSMSKRLPKWRRIMKAYVKDLSHLASVYIASVYIQLSSHLTLENEQIFVIFSIGFR